MVKEPNSNKLSRVLCWVIVALPIAVMLMGSVLLFLSANDEMVPLFVFFWKRVPYTLLFIPGLYLIENGHTLIGVGLLCCFYLVLIGYTVMIIQAVYRDRRWQVPVYVAFGFNLLIMLLSAKILCFLVDVVLLLLFCWAMNLNKPKPMVILHDQPYLS